MGWPMVSNEKRSAGQNFDAELKLLRYLAENSTTQLTEELIYAHCDNRADVEELIIRGLIIEKPVRYDDKVKKYYKISSEGYRFVKEEENREQNKRILIIAGLTLLVSILGLIVAALK
ncbi:hypothetical protein HY572_05340 [Candidatus Micrarchaeota archaeon]|nr:hypothetical protein [Candidatus Micrarchaeota archaeon]